MNTTDKDTTPMLSIEGYKVTVVNCPDSATARALAAQRIREIENRIMGIKSERTMLNRQRHALTQWLDKLIRQE